MELIKWIFNKKTIEKEREVEDAQYNAVLTKVAKLERQLEQTESELFKHLTKAEKKQLEKARK